MFIDTHTHIYLDQFKDDINQVIESAISHGVNMMVLPNVDSSTTDKMLSLTKRYPNNTIAMPGLHPCSVKENYKEELNHVLDLLNKDNYNSIGEIGIDLYWDKTFYKEQVIAYKTQIEWSKERKIPFVIHSRDSLDETIGIVEEMQDGNLTGIFHCFNGTLEQSKRIIDLGFYMGIGGVVTFKNAGVDKVVEHIPLDNLVLETDAPYLTPAPHRRDRNEPSYIPIIAQKIADLHKIDIELVAKVTSNNAQKIFNLTL